MPVPPPPDLTRFFLHHYVPNDSDTLDQLESYRLIFPVTEGVESKELLIPRIKINSRVVDEFTTPPHRSLCTWYNTSILVYRRYLFRTAAAEEEEK